MDDSSLNLFSFLSRFRYLKSYKDKILLVAFLGTHVPLLTLLVYFVTSSSFTLETTVRVLVIALVATLTGTAATLYALHNLLAPVTLTSLALQKYLSGRTLPNLPTQFTDEAGTLMANTSRVLKQLDQVIRHMANYDDLTGLPNRVLFRNRLQQAIAQAQQDSQQLAVIGLDLDGFKDINNALGHGAGDVLLRTVAQRLTGCLQETDILSRLGSDEFAIVQPITTSESAIALSQALLDTLAKPFFLEGQEVHTSASVGVTLYPLDDTNVDQLLQNADAAVHQAKRQERNTYQFYSAEMNAKLQERLALENELRYALVRGELFPHYQPRIDLASGRTVAVEALLRWQNPRLGLVSPERFIPIAEETGLIIPIGEWVLRSACAQNRTWQATGLPPVRVSVNLSARQFQHKNLVEMVDQVLVETGLDAAYLELEVTESMLIDDVERAIKTLQQLHDRGIALSLDDFGTGYSSMSYLRRFPIDTLKIDRSFVREVASNPDDAAIARAIIALAHSLQLNITAEGVETQEQLNYLETHGCHEVQGYYFSRPVAADALANLLRQEQSLNPV